MSKWLKVLGLSAAVGAVVYGVIKYKSDDKFKKQVDDTVEEVKEKVQETTEKVSKFVSDHPVATVLCVASVGFGIAALRRMRTEQQKTIRIERSYQTYTSEPDPSERKQKIYEDIMENPGDYYIIRKDDYEQLCDAAAHENGS